MPDNRNFEDLLDRFDFFKVHYVMTLLNWTWTDEGVPSPTRLRKRAKELLETLRNSPITTRIGSGGFWASKSRDESGNYSYCLLFSVDWAEDDE